MPEYIATYVPGGVTGRFGRICGTTARFLTQNAEVGRAAVQLSDMATCRCAGRWASGAGHRCSRLQADFTQVKRRGFGRSGAEQGGHACTGDGQIHRSDIYSVRRPKFHGKCPTISAVRAGSQPRRTADKPGDGHRGSIALDQWIVKGLRAPIDYQFLRPSDSEIFAHDHRCHIFVGVVVTLDHPQLGADASAVATPKFASLPDSVPPEELPPIAAPPDPVELAPPDEPAPPVPPSIPGELTSALRSGADSLVHAVAHTMSTAPAVRYKRRDTDSLCHHAGGSHHFRPETALTVPGSRTRHGLFVRTNSPIGVAPARHHRGKIS